ncbi:MAG: hypothetical protein ACK5JM_03780 [Rhodoblastus sp.]
MSDASAIPAEGARAARLRNRAILGLVSFLIVLPTALFAIALNPLPAAILLVGCAGVLAIAVQQPASAQMRDGIGAHVLDRPLDMRALAISIAISAAIFILGGALHLFYAPQDWRIRDAVLGDLARYGFPLIYDDKGREYLLRAPLGMYMAPALAGRMFGAIVAHAVMLVQNSVLLGATLYLLGAMGRGWRHMLILVLFSGFAVFGLLLLTLLGEAIDWERMLLLSLDAWLPKFQYSSAITQFFWVPNHALPGWWLATLLILQTRGEIDMATVAAGIGGAMFWSPLVVLPVALWIAISILWNLRENLALPRIWAVLVLGLCFLPTALYMVIGAGEISHGVPAAGGSFAFFYAIFMCAQIWQPAFVFAHRALMPPALFRLFVFSFCVLALLPFVSFGPANDLMMRGSIPALVVVAYAFGWVALDAGLSRNARWFAVVLIAGCSASALLETIRAIAAKPYEISDCSLFEATRALGADGVATNYATERAHIPGWLMNLGRAPHSIGAERRCWSDLNLRQGAGSAP